MKAKKKKRQVDFQKVKLKVGKTKPKANNATNTNFRTKGIYLSEQLNKDTSGPTTHRQLGINVSSLYYFTCWLTCHYFSNTTNLFFLLLYQDLLSQLHHYNDNVKHSALLGLRELLTLNPSLLEQHLCRLLSEVAAVFTDKDGSVRSASARLLK